MKPETGPVVDSMYAAREKVYPREIKGRFQSLRNLAVVTLLGLYYFLPWVNWSGRQAVLFDLPARKFYIFGLVLWPQDFVYLALLLIIAALSLFFFTALAGRLWCGYACPQTVWTEVFLWMERLTEGDRGKRMKLDRGPWNREKILRKGSKQVLWIAFAAFTGFTFVGFFSPVRDLWAHISQFSLGPWETFWIVFYSFATYGNAGFLREQVCIYMCPYARFQSAMFDRDTLIISYDEVRGEPRGGRKRGVDPRTAGKGDCIDCNMCVQVCPTGIDIREGLQYECIACAACVDVCDSVMDKMDYPRGLIRYTTQNALDGKGKRVLRPRVMVYAAILLALAGGFVYSVATRNLLAVDVLHDRNALYRVLDDGRIENVYTLKIMNKDIKPHRYTLTVAGIPHATLSVDDRLPEVDAGEVATLPVRVRVPADEAKGGPHSIIFTLHAEDAPEQSVHETGKFLAPMTLPR